MLSGGFINKILFLKRQFLSGNVLNLFQGVRKVTRKPRFHRFSGEILTVVGDNVAQKIYLVLPIDAGISLLIAL